MSKIEFDVTPGLTRDGKIVIYLPSPHKEKLMTTKWDRVHIILSPAYPDGRKYDKPDPQADDEIFGALEAWWTGGDASSKKLRLRAFRAIQAGIQKNKRVIGEVDKRRYMDSRRISDHDGEIDALGVEIEAVRKEPYTPALEARVSQLEVYSGRDIERIESLERKVERIMAVITDYRGNIRQIGPEIDQCIKHDPDMLKQVTEWRKEIQHKVKELEKRFKAHGVAELIFGERQSQPKGGVARDLMQDKNGEPHELRPKQSVLRCISLKTLYLFHRTKADSPETIYAQHLEEPDRAKDTYLKRDFIWIRDLDSPQDSGSSKAGIVALKRCLSIFQELADQGNYPKMLVGEGWGWLIDAISFATAKARGDK